MIIEAKVREYLETTLKLKCYTEKESNMPKTYCLIEKTGGSTKNHVNNATIAIQSYAETLAKASMLNEKVKEAMENIVENTNISRSSLNSDYNFTDQTVKVYRYQAIYDITYM